MHILNTLVPWIWNLLNSFEVFETIRRIYRAPGPLTNTKFDFALFRAVYIYFGNTCDKYLQEAWPKYFPSPKWRKSPYFLSTPPRYGLYTVIKGSSMETSFILDNFSQNVLKCLDYHKFVSFSLNKREKFKNVPKLI